MKELKMYVYRVGHGVFTLLHGIHDDGKTPFNAVFDCGYHIMCVGEDCNIIEFKSDYFSQNIIGHAASIILANENDKLDFLVSSHQDMDHNNLIMELLQKLNNSIQPFTSIPWFSNDSGMLINGYKNSARLLYTDQSNNLIYQFSRELDGNKCEMTQIISLADKNAEKYVTWLQAQVSNMSYKDKYGNLPDVHFAFVMNLKSKTEQSKKKKSESIVCFTQIDITTFFYCVKKFTFSLEIENKFPLNVWYEQVISIIYPKFRDEFLRCYPPLYNNVLKNLKDWLNIVGASYFGSEDVMGNSVNLTNLYNAQKGKAYKPSFKIGTAIMGGFSDKNAYNKLCLFLCKYMQKIVQFGNYYRNAGYTYLDMDFRGVREESISFTEYVPDTAEEDSGEEKKEYIYNSTSTVINFIYYDLKNNACSVLFPGDVTVNHFLDISNRIGISEATCRYMIAPHHGSLDTNFLWDENKQLISKQYQPLYIMYKGMKKNEKNTETLISECFCNIYYCTPCEKFVTIAREFAPNVSQHTIHMFGEEKNQQVHKSMEIKEAVYLTGDMDIKDNFVERTLVGKMVCRTPHAAERPKKPPRTLPPDYLFV